MFASLAFNFRQRVSDLIFRARFPERPPVVLIQRRIFILPSRTGYFFAFVLLLLLVASINYSLSLGYLLTFLLAGMGGVGMFHTFRNLLRLSISPGKVEPVFAGETAHFSIVVSNPTLSRYALGIKRAQIRDAEPEFSDAGTETSTTFLIPMMATKRGEMKCGRLEIFSEYPVGLFHAWSYVDFGTPCLVYPKPDPGAGALPLDMRAKGEGNVPVRGDEEFQSLRAYRAGDTPRQIAWKALARGQGLLVKEFGATASADLWLDFDALPALSTEERLSRLTWWVIEAERSQLPYGLKLSSQTIRPALGQKHRDACLRALALYGLAD
ncbi:MAG: DUF58 domain-containing protein [Usitatibacteraceae bacterium]